MADVNTVTISIEDEDGNADDVEIAADILDMIRENDESDSAVVGDLVALSIASRVHHLVAHGGGDPSEEMKAIEDVTMDLFEERFGQSFAELTGHQH